MTVQLQVGMTAIRRDGVRKAVATSRDIRFPFSVDGWVYPADGTCCSRPDCQMPIIAAGFPWATLGAQVGDTVRLMWSGKSKRVVGDWDFIVKADDEYHPDSLYVMVKPADREIEWGEWASGRPVGPISQTENINGRIRHRIPKPTPDEVIVRYGFPEDADGMWTAKRHDADTYRYKIIFPAGGDVGTVTREKL